MGRYYFKKTLAEDPLAEELIRKEYAPEGVMRELILRDEEQKEQGMDLPHGHQDGWHEVPDWCEWYDLMKKRRVLGFAQMVVEAGKVIRDHLQESVDEFVGKTL